MGTEGETGCQFTGMSNSFDKQETRTCQSSSQWRGVGRFNGINLSLIMQTFNPPPVRGKERAEERREADEYKVE